MKQIRFGDLVRNSGRPHTLTLWTAPEKNAELQTAIRSNRVLSVQQPNVGTKRDFGTVGFHSGDRTSYLIFPQSLEASEGERVIGINYALIEEPIPSEPVRLPTMPARTVQKIQLPPKLKPIPKKAPEPKPEPPPRKFHVTVRSQAIIESKLEVEAKSRAEASARAIEEASKITPLPDQWKRRVVRVSQRT
jgi:hypothetical protein